MSRITNKLISAFTALTHHNSVILVSYVIQLYNISAIVTKWNRCEQLNFHRAVSHFVATYHAKVLFLVTASWMLYRCFSFLVFCIKLCYMDSKFLPLIQISYTIYFTLMNRVLFVWFVFVFISAFKFLL